MRTVLEIQQRLLSLGYTLPKFGADGFSGAETTAAIKKYQVDEGLPSTGKADAATLAALFGDFTPRVVASGLKYRDFKGPAKRIDDIDLPRIAHMIGCGEDEMHAFIETETRGTGFDAQGRPLILFEPHKFFANLGAGAKRDAAVRAGLAYPKWGQQPYPRDSYPHLIEAMKIDETAALKSASWGLGQVMGGNYASLGYATVQDLVNAACEDEEHHLEMMVAFIEANDIDDDLRALAALRRPTLPADCVAIVRVYNGSGYAKNNYHVKFADMHNKWKKIRDTPFNPDVDA